MEHSIEVVSPVARKISVTVPAAGVNAVLDSTVRGFGANLSLDGFRKGKVPARVIERRFPEEIVSRATETLVNGQVSEILEKEGLNPISRIEFDSGDARQVERDQSFSFTFSFEVLPDSIELPEDMSALSVDVEAPELKPEEVESITMRIRKTMATLDEVTENRLPQDGDVVLVDVEGTVDGKPAPGMSARNFLMQLRAPKEGDKPADVETVVRTLHAGEEGEGSMVASEDHPDPSLRGRTVQLKVKLHKISREVLPDLNDEFAKKVGFEDIGKLHQAILDQAMNNKLREIRSKGQQKLLDSLLDDLPGAREDSFWSKLRDNIRNFQEVRQVETPAGLNAELRPYQLQGVSYLNFLDEYGFGGILADEMGLGKTIQTLSFIQHMVNKGATGPNLIVVPTSVLPNWDREASKFVPKLSRVIVYGTRRESIFRKIADADLVITTYALLRRDLEELEQHNFNAIILDEAQNIKNPNTITARAVRNIHARMRLCLSGTPIENNLFELWSLFEFLMPGFLGSQHAFQRGVIKPIKEGDAETLEYLRSRVKPFILRRTKAEVVRDLPPKIESVTYCALADEQAELYAALARKLRDQVLADVDQKGMAKSQMSILDALLKLRQICCHPKLLKMDMPGFNSNMVSGKFEAFKDMIIDIVEEGHKVLVFSQFVQMLQQIRGWLQMTDIPFCYLDGSSKDRLEQVDRFNNSPDIPIFLISLKAGGTGLNLTSADYVIHYDPWWNPAVESQATDRAHRIGQARQVFSYKLICQNTVEEKILKLQDMKRGVAEAVIPGQDSWKSLTREDLEMLFEV